ncbi:MAG: 3-isopropylmalate dehydratase large subunit [Methylobacteriaceae bacterium]|nr:3-isopropylmalate dehydratase large subunit [Methylobacteriaceae bacterium]
MHALEKILAKKAGKASVTTGEIVDCEIDLAGVNDLYLQTVRSFAEIGATQVRAPERMIMFLDHYAPASTVGQADNQKKFREFCRLQGVSQVMDINEGVCHQVAADRGLVGPGKLIIITDSHSTTHGALGAFGTGVGATDMATILATGRLWLRVPEVIRIRLDGTLKRGVYAKDVILHVIGSLGADYAVYKAVEFIGPVVAGFSVSERMALCNMTTEMGAKTAYIQPDDVTMAYVREHTKVPYEVVETDPDFTYAEELSFDVSGIGPQVAAPSSVDNVHPIGEYAGVKIDQAYIGSCTGGRLEDLTIAAGILKNRKIAPTTRLIVVPATKKVLLDGMAAGVIPTLIEAGATLVTPSCAACLGTHEGILAPGEVCITATNRNFPGRMGSRDASLFLGSPATVAASALEGAIADPTPYLA